MAEMASECTVLPEFKTKKHHCLSIQGGQPPNLRIMLVYFYLFIQFINPHQQ